MLVPAVATVATTSSIFLIRDLYLYSKFTTEQALIINSDTNTNNKKKKDDDDGDHHHLHSDMHQVPPGGASSSSTSHDRLSALEEKGVALARLRSIRILSFLALILICVLVVTDAQSAASSLYEAYATSPSISSTSGIAILCNNVTKASASNTAGTVSLLFSLYLVLQTFSIPGTIALNAVLGALLGTSWGVPSCVVAGTIGACCCYTLSSAIGTGFAHALDKKLMNGRGIHQLRTQVNRYRSELLTYLLFLRLTPVLPNWLINLASPILGVPLSTFAFATFVGIAPQTYLSVRFGAAAKTLSENFLVGGAGGSGGAGKIVTVWDTLLIALLGVMVVVIHKLKAKFSPAK